MISFGNDLVDLVHPVFFWLIPKESKVGNEHMITQSKITGSLCHSNIPGETKDSDIPSLSHPSLIVRHSSNNFVIPTFPRNVPSSKLT